RAATRRRQRGGIRPDRRPPEDDQALRRCELNDSSPNRTRYSEGEAPMATTSTTRGGRTTGAAGPDASNPAVNGPSVGGRPAIAALPAPGLNRATAYTEAERQALGLVGLVPDVTESEDLQLRRVLQQLGHKTTDLERYIYLVNLLDNDETLFYRTLMSD